MVQRTNKPKAKRRAVGTNGNAKSKAKAMEEEVARADRKLTVRSDKEENAGTDAKGEQDGRDKPKRSTKPTKTPTANPRQHTTHPCGCKTSQIRKYGCTSPHMMSTVCDTHMPTWDALDDGKGWSARHEARRKDLIKAITKPKILEKPEE